MIFDHAEHHANILRILRYEMTCKRKIDRQKSSINQDSEYEERKASASMCIINERMDESENTIVRERLKARREKVLRRKDAKRADDVLLMQ
jgi:hypothetical protein